MKIYKVEKTRDLLDLLLIGDEQESMIEKYVDRCTAFVIEDGVITGEICVTDEGSGILEIKNLAVYPQFQKRGYGKKLINFICKTYKKDFCTVRVGTGDSPLTLPFYEKCGFKKVYSVKNFFYDNYDHPIIENGVRLCDMVYLEKSLK